MEERRMIDEAIAASLAEVERREMGGEVPEAPGLSPNARCTPEVSDDDDNEDYLTLPDESEDTE
jgi:hypothetical protein